MTMSSHGALATTRWLKTSLMKFPMAIDGVDTATITVNVSGVNDTPTADPINETRVKLADDLRIDLIADANASDIVDDSDTLAVLMMATAAMTSRRLLSRVPARRASPSEESSAYTLNGQRETSLTLNPGRTYIFDWSEHTRSPTAFV